MVCSWSGLTWLVPARLVGLPACLQPPRRFSRRRRARRNPPGDLVVAASSPAAARCVRSNAGSYRAARGAATAGEPHGWRRKCVPLHADLELACRRTGHNPATLQVASPGGPVTRGRCSQVGRSCRIRQQLFRGRVPGRYARLGSWRRGAVSAHQRSANASGSRSRGLAFDLASPDSGVVSEPATSRAERIGNRDVHVLVIVAARRFA